MKKLPIILAADRERLYTTRVMPWELLQLIFEWHLTDAIGRTWQVGTIQSDRVLPDRLDAHYIGEDGEKHRPVMLHRAIFGSYERFIGILIEHFAGKLPAWLAPVQAVVATIVSDADPYAEDVAAQLRAAGIRVETDTRNEKINYKVREHSLAKVPHLLVVGKREAEAGAVAVRLRSGEDLGAIQVDEFLAMAKGVIDSKSISLTQARERPATDVSPGA